MSIFQGGYITVDMGGTEITSDGVSMPGVYEKINEVYGKPFIFKNINLGGTELDVLVAAGYNKDHDDIQCFLSADGSLILLIAAAGTVALVS